MAETYIMDTLTIGKEKIPVKLMEMNQIDLLFYPENPRVYSTLNSDGAIPSQEDIEEHMKKHASIVRKRFQIVLKRFKELGECGIASWTNPKGGYFISLYTLEGCAKRTVELCKDAGAIRICESLGSLP